MAKLRNDRMGIARCLYYPLPLALGLLLSSISTAQVLISYPYVAQSIAACEGSDSLWIRLDLTKTTQIEAVEIQFPQDVTYVPGSLRRLEGSVDFVLAEQDLSDLSRPVFSAGSSSYRIGQYLTFLVLRNAYCTGAQNFGHTGLFKDIVRVKTNEGWVEDFDLEVNSYQILMPTLILSPPVPQTNTIPQSTYTRNLSIANTGSGCTGHLDFYAVYPVGSVRLTNLSLGNAALLPTRSSGDTLWYELTGALLGADSSLCPGERLALQERVQVLDCAPATAYGLGWGCGQGRSAWCERTEVKGLFVLANGTPIPQATARVTQQVSFCREGIVEMTYRNAGTGTSLGTMYNLVIQLGHNAGTTANLPRRDAAITITKASINGRVVTLTQSGAEPWIFNCSQFLTDPDGAGGLTDLDGDGQYDDLPPGASFILQFTEKMRCSESCPMPDYAFAIRTKVDYTTLCQGAKSSLNLITDQPYYIYHTPTNQLSFTAPAQVLSGEVIRFQACYSTQYNPPVFRPTDSVCFELNLPAGVRLNGPLGRFQINGVNVAAADISVQGSRVRIRRKGYSQPLCYSFEAVYDCSPAFPSADLKFDFRIFYVGDNSCSCVQQWACRSHIVKAACLECKDQPGVLNSSPRVERLSYGFTDNTLRTRVDPNTLPALSRQSMAARDEFKLSMGGRQQGSIGQQFNNLHFYYQINKAAGQEVILFKSGTLTWYRGTQKRRCPLGLPTTQASTSQQIMDWDLSSLLGACLPLNLESGDSLLLELHFSVSTANNGLLFGTTHQIAPGQLAYFYNSTTNNQRLYCNAWVPPLYIVGQQRFTHAYGGTNLAGCNVITTENDYGAFYTDPVDLFPGEYRPFAYLDSIVYTLPPGFRLDPNGTVQLLTTNWSKVTQVAANSNFKLSPIIRDNQLVFINPGNWPTSDMTYQLNFMRNRLHVPIVSSCESPTGNLSGQVQYFAKDYFYAGDNAQPAVGGTPTGNINVVNSERPSLSLLNLTGVVEGSSPGKWEVEIRNPTTQRAPFLWVAFEDGPDQLGIDIRSVNQGAFELKPLPYSNGKWYKVETSGVSPGEVIKLTIGFTYQNCAPDSLRMLAGWDCMGYPISPTSSNCAANNLSLKVAPRNAALKLSLVNAPVADLPQLCSPFSMELEYASIQLGNVFVPRVLVDLPQGLLLNRLRLEYPRGSGNWETISPVRTGNRLSIDLTGHSKIAQKNIPGTLFSDLETDRIVGIALEFNTDCDFSPGTTIHFTADGQMDCGASAQGSGVTLFSEAITIAGVTAPYVPVITATKNIVLDGCNKLADLKLSVALLKGKTTITQADRTLLYLPAGVEYVSYSCTSPNRNNCPTGNPTSTTDAVSGETLLTFTLPNGIPQISGDSVSLNLKIRPKADVQCGSNFTYRIEQRYRARGLFCGRLRCPEMDFVASLYNQGAINIVKPNVQIAALKAAYGSPTAKGYPVYYEGTLRVLDRKSGQGYIDVDLYCADANRQPTGNRVATQRIDLNQDQVFVPIRGSFIACNPTLGIVLQIRMGQCVCAQTALVLKPLAPCPQISIKANKLAFCAGEKPALTATLSNGATAGTWRTLGSGTFSSLTNLSSTYTPSTTDISRGNVQLIYGGITGFCGLIEDTLTLSLLPTPSLQVPDSLVVCNGVKSDTLFLRGSPADASFRWTNNNLTIGLAGSGQGHILPFQAVNSGAQIVQARLSIVPELSAAGTTCHGTAVDVLITVNPDVISRDSLTVCSGKSFQLNAPPGGSAYLWTPSAGLQNARTPTPTHPRGINSNTSYLSNYRTANNCFGKHTVEVKTTDCNRSAQLGNRVWHDLNYNGLQDANEGGLSNVQVLLFKDTQTSAIATRTSDVQGRYTFTDLEPGAYRLGVNLPPRAKLTQLITDSLQVQRNSDLDPQTGFSPIFTLEAGNVDTLRDIGLVFPVKISGLAWLDENANGLRDTGEQLLPGIKVLVYPSDEPGLLQQNLFEQAWFPRFTDRQGRYDLDSLAPGRYTLEFVADVVPAYQEYSITNADAEQNALDSLDSDVQGNSSQARTSVIPDLISGEEVRHLDAGYLPAPCPPLACTARLGQWKVQDLRWNNPSSSAVFDTELSYQTCDAEETPLVESDIWPYLLDPQRPGQKIYLTDTLFQCALTYTWSDVRQARCNGQGAEIVRTIVLRDVCQNQVLDTLKVLIKLYDREAPQLGQKPAQELQLTTPQDSCQLLFPVDSTGLANLGIRATDNCQAPRIQVRFYSPKIDATGIQWEEQLRPVGSGGVLLPLGKHRVRFTLQDACENTALDSIELEVLPEVQSTQITCMPPAPVDLSCQDARLPLLDRIEKNSAVFGSLQAKFPLQACFPIDTTYRIQRHTSLLVDSIWRTWTLGADLPNQRISSTCTQLITVSRLREYRLILPADASSLNCQEAGIPTPRILADSCLSFSVSSVDRRQQGTQGACFDVERTYTIRGSSAAFTSNCNGDIPPQVDTLPSFLVYPTAARMELHVTDPLRNGQEQFVGYWWDSENKLLDSTRIQPPTCLDGRPLHYFVFKQIIHHFDKEVPQVNQPLPLVQSIVDLASCRGRVTLAVRAKDRCVDSLRILPDRCKIALRQSLVPADWQPVAALDSNWSWRFGKQDTLLFELGQMPVGRHDFLLILSDACGNTSREIRVPFEIADPLQHCALVPVKPGISGLIYTEYGREINRVELKLEGSANRNATTDLRGAFTFNDLPEGGNFKITPLRDDDHRNGVSTYDIVLVGKHIIQEKTLNSAYKRIAADVDKSGTISVLDMVLMRRLVLALDLRFPNNTAWRFVDAAFPLKPESIHAGFPDTIQINQLKNALRADFVGVKTGDVSGDVRTQLRSDAVQVQKSPLKIMASLDQNILTGLITCVLPSAPLLLRQVESIQFTLAFDPQIITLEGIDYGVFNAENIGVFAAEGLLTFSWNGSEADLRKATTLFSLRFKAHHNNNDHKRWLRLLERPTPTEIVTAQGQLIPLALQWQEEFPKMILAQNHPNPFTQVSSIAFYLPAATAVSVCIHNAAGQLIYCIKGNYTAGWQDLLLDRRLLPAPGWYTYTLITDYGIATQKMIVIDS